jgi:hypothetical protein
MIDATVDNGHLWLASENRRAPERGSYFLRCCVCGWVDYFHWKHFSPKGWEFVCFDIERPTYPAKSYTCDKCRGADYIPPRDRLEEYAVYLRGSHWQSVRKAALERANSKCQLCASQVHLEVHHNTYDNLWNEPASDVIVLCRRCHGRHHGKVAEIGS